MDKEQAMKMMLSAYRNLLTVSKQIEAAGLRGDEYVILNGRIYTTVDMVFLMTAILQTEPGNGA